MLNGPLLNIIIDSKLSKIVFHQKSVYLKAIFDDQLQSVLATLTQITVTIFLKIRKFQIFEQCHTFSCMLRSLLLAKL